MATRYNVSGLTLQVDKKLGQRVLKAAAPRIAATQARILSAQTQIHYQNAIEQVADFVSSPDRQGIGRGGPQNLNIRSVDGAMHHVTTHSWAPLTIDYSSRKPQSTTFWYKRGRQMATFLARIIPGQATTAARTVSIIGQSNSRRAHIEVTFSPLKAPMDELIRYSFLDGISDLQVKSRGILANVGRVAKGPSLGKYTYVEGARPAISLIASTLGRNLLRVLRTKV